VACLLLLPLLYTEGLPKLALLAPFLAPAPPAAAPPQQSHRNLSSTPQSNLIGTRLLAPSEIPRDVSMLAETEPPPPLIDPGAVGVRHGFGDAPGGTVLDAVLGSGPSLPPPPPVVHHPPVSHMMEGNLIYRVQPSYPALARQARIQGQVVLRAMISRAGAIENLEVLSGHPMLAPAAVDAVRRWRYRPYVLNGEPVEVETQVTVNFVLGGDSQWLRRWLGSSTGVTSWAAWRPL